MENSPLSDQPTSEEDDVVVRDSSSRREQRSHDRELPARAATHTRGARPRVRSWMRAGALDWGIRIAVVGLVIGGFFAIYINGVAEGWWHPWGEAPTVTTTGPTAVPTPAPTASSEPAMSGGYQIGPDGVLVRPAEYAPETYPKPELPEVAKENSERGAEAAAEHSSPSWSMRGTPETRSHSLICRLVTRSSRMRLRRRSVISTVMDGYMTIALL